METLKKINDALSGWKTYAAGVLAVGVGVYLKSFELIIIGFIAMGLRDAISNK